MLCGVHAGQWTDLWCAMHLVRCDLRMDGRCIVGANFAVTNSPRPRAHVTLIQKQLDRRQTCSTYHCLTFTILTRSQDTSLLASPSCDRELLQYAQADLRKHSLIQGMQ